MDFFESFKKEDEYVRQFRSNPSDSRYNAAYEALPLIISTSVVKYMSEEELEYYRNIALEKLQALAKNYERDPHDERNKDYFDSYNFYNKLSLEDFRESLIYERDFAAKYKEQTGKSVPRLRYSCPMFCDSNGTYLYWNPIPNYEETDAMYLLNSYGYGTPGNSGKTLLERVDEMAKERSAYVKKRLEDGLTIPEIHAEVSGFDNYQDFYSVYGDLIDKELQGKSR